MKNAKAIMEFIKAIESMQTDLFSYQAKLSELLQSKNLRIGSLNDLFFKTCIFEHKLKDLMLDRFGITNSSGYIEEQCKIKDFITEDPVLFAYVEILICTYGKLIEIIVKELNTIREVEELPF